MEYLKKPISKKPISTFKDFYLMPHYEDHYTLSSFNWSYFSTRPGSEYFWEWDPLTEEKIDVSTALNIDKYIRVFRKSRRHW